MQGIKRKLVYVTAYEMIGMSISTLGISLLEAFWLDLALIVLIPCYTFLFNWAFDRLFGLPASALPAGEAASV
ncbi:chlorhexidine efflux transporter [Pseudomonas aeruginosa]